jgi:ABC-type branched-subunit amino acid transport system substrate-binding protein
MRELLRAGAIGHYQRALDIADQEEDYRAESAVLGNLGSAYAALDETSQAIKYYEQALIAADRETQRYETDSSDRADLTGTLLPPETTVASNLQKSRFQRSRKAKFNLLYIALASLLFALIIFSSAAYIVYVLPNPNSNNCDPNRGIPASGLCVVRASNNEFIGVSNGIFAFDTKRSDGALKQQAASDFNTGNINAAKLHWQEAVNIETNDAEALIQLENLRVLASRHPYITFIVVTTLSGDDASITTGRSNLQGAYLAQKEYNDASTLSAGVQVRLLIANIGGQSTFATFVEKQIVQVAHADRTVVGVMGWPSNSGSTIDAINSLGKAGIPMVSPSASSNLLTGISPYFFRVVPSLESQAFDAAKYAEQTLHAKQAAIFYDPSSPYSESLAASFKEQFTADGNSIVAQETYTSGHPETILDLLHASLLVNPDLIYFSGSPTDIAVVLNNLPSPGPKVMGGDILSRMIYFPNNLQVNLNHLYFTAFAYSDTWNFLKLPQPSFFNSYSQTFDPSRQHVGNPYGYTRPDSDSILAYDAMLAVLTASKNILAKGKTSFTSIDLRHALAKIAGSQAVEGVSGLISFEPDGDPVHKAIVVLSASPNGHFQVISVLGHFSANAH